MKGTKGPKVRFPPGTFVKMTDDLCQYEVVQVYRLMSAPSNWVYREPKSFGSFPLSMRLSDQIAMCVNQESC